MQENYVALTGAIAMERRMGLISNNLANVNTAGYYGDHITVGGVSGAPNYKAMADSSSRDLKVDTPQKAFHECLFGVLSGQHTNYTPGGFRETGNRTDLAIQGDGFFAVQTAGGVRYTRQGSFTLNSQGALTTQNGDPVLGENGQPVQIASDDFAIQKDGSISDKSGQNLGKVQVAVFSDKRQLIKEGAGMFRPFDENVKPQPAAPGAADVHAGCIEGSNVEVVDELVDMIATQRNYDTFQKLIRASDEMSSTLISSVIA